LDGTVVCDCSKVEISENKKNKKIFRVERWAIFLIYFPGSNFKTVENSSSRSTLAHLKPDP
jgi:hypothetical protein